MTRPPSAPRSRRWGLAAAWTLGTVAVLGTLATSLSRVMEAGARPALLPPKEPSLLLGPPDRRVALGDAGASRIDTLESILSVTDAVELDTAWAVLDARAHRIHVVPDRPGAPVLHVGREGDGPGEMRDPAYLAVSGKQMAALERRGDRLVRFDRNGEVLGPVSLGHPTCGFGPAQSLAGDPSGGFLALRTCIGADRRSRALLLRVAPDGRVEVLANQPLQSLVNDEVDPFAVPVAAVLGGARYLGVLAEGCLVRLDPDPGTGAPGSVCTPEDERVALPDSVRQRYEALAGKMARAGGRLAIPRWLPPFGRVRTSPAGVVLSVPLSGGGGALDLVDPRGRRTRFVPEADGVAVFIGRRHVLVGRDLMKGAELVWTPLDG
ncbi:MAG TPA: hypothetical protein VE173_14755 [Longimicrobiales bacterium]|nr:hypothetical protein [Longimicrobiales bacterium]